MFEYHNNRLTVDADGVSVTVELAEPLDIQTTLADLDLKSSKIIGAGQTVIDYDRLPNYADAPSEEEEENPNYFFLNGFTLSSLNDHANGQYEGYGNEEVIARAVPYQELGIRGLLAFCAKERQDLEELLEQLNKRSDELEQIAKQQEADDAAELERTRPMRSPEIALEELRQFAILLGIDPENGTTWNTFYRQINERRINLGWENSLELNEVYSKLYMEHWPGKSDGIVVDQVERNNSFSSRLGQVCITKRGYFAACKRESISDSPLYDEEYIVGFETPQEALEATAIFVADGDEQSWDNFVTLPGLPR